MVKVAIVDSNHTYLERLHNYWSKTYGSGALMVFVFSSYDQLLERVQSEKIDIVLLNNHLEADLELLPKRILKLYLLPGKKSGEINGIPALPKNGNADELYRKIIELYDQHMNIDHITIPGQMLFFTSPLGGSGASSCAVGCGKYLASIGKKVLYLNLENISAMELMLDGEPKQSLEDLFYLCKTKRKNLSFSIDSMTASDSSGLKYIAQCKNPMELQEMTVEDMKAAITTITEKGAFDVVIVDRGFSLEQITMELMTLAKRVVMVCDSSSVGSKKLARVKDFLQEADHRGIPVSNKVKVLFNKATSEMEQSEEVLGSIPFLSNADTGTVVMQIGQWRGFDGLFVEEEQQD